jgi:hypothetical protein
MDDQGINFQFLAGVGKFSLIQETSSGAHLASHPMDNRGSFSRGKDAGT